MKGILCDEEKSLRFYMAAASEGVTSKKPESFWLGEFPGTFHHRVKFCKYLLVSPLEGRGWKMQTPGSMSAI